MGDALKVCFVFFCTLSKFGLVGHHIKSSIGTGMDNLIGAYPVNSNVGTHNFELYAPT